MFASDIIVDDECTGMGNAVETSISSASSMSGRSPMQRFAYLDGMRVEVEYDGDSMTCWKADDGNRMPIDPRRIVIAAI